ncbi:MAG: glycosyltransferase family 4 protein [Microthrixaceae bacterium]
MLPPAGPPPQAVPPTAQTPTASEATLSAIAELAARTGLTRIHMLAWRDLDDDEAGGSEVHAHSIAAIWAQAGLEVTMRTSAAVGQPANARRGGYTVSRRAGRYGVFPRSALAEITGRLGPCDALVEIWNGMPFMSPIWWRKPRVIWLHHVHGPMWAMSLPGPVAKAGVALEERIAPRFYRRQPIVTLSPSSYDELVDDLGFSPSLVRVIPPGLNPYFTPGAQRSSSPLVVAVGRLVPVKDFPRLVRVMAAAHERVPDAELVIVGEGYERDRIEATIAECGGADWVTLAGRVSDEELRDLYRRAWLAASVSVHEGWGMTLTEAAACATPAVATDISGHADAIARDRSGLLRSDDAGLADAIASVLGDADLRARLQAGALARAGELTWERTALANFEVLAADALRRQGRHTEAAELLGGT